MSEESQDRELIAHTLRELEGSDAQIARVTEDLVSILIAKNLILFTDLPEAVQQKLLYREKLREKLRAPIVSIVSDDETL